MNETSSYASAATAADFNEKVIWASHEVPVMVDFWAEWCGPCKSLAPVLHELVQELNGAVRLVTVDTDREAELARRYGIRSLPTVMLFEGGGSVDQFMGALPASRVREFLEPYIVRESDRRADEAARLAEQGDLEAARAAYEEALTGDPGNLQVRLRYARAMVEAGDAPRAAELLRDVPVASASDPHVLRLQALIQFSELIGPGGNDPAAEGIDDDPAALRELAARKVLKGDYAGAMDLLLELMRKHRSHGDDAARKDLLAVFDLVDDPGLVKRYQRQMASLLY